MQEDETPVEGVVRHADDFFYWTQDKLILPSATGGPRNVHPITVRCYAEGNFPFYIFPEIKEYTLAGDLAPSTKELLRKYACKKGDVCTVVYMLPDREEILSVERIYNVEN